MADKRPVRDTGEPYRTRPYTAGGTQGSPAERKTALMSTGTTGYIPGRSDSAGGFAYEAPEPTGPVPGSDELEYGPRPRLRDIPVHSWPGHTGSFVRYLDGHTEVHRERPGLVEMMHDPDTHPDDKQDIADEIADRDDIHKHTFW